MGVVKRKPHCMAPSGMFDAQRSHTYSTSLHGNCKDVKAAQGNGCNGVSLEKALASLSMETVTAGECIVISPPSQVYRQ